MKMGDQFQGGRKCGEDFARRRPSLVFLQAFFIAQFLQEIGLQATDGALAIVPGHHDFVLRLLGTETDVFRSSDLVRGEHVGCGGPCWRSIGTAPAPYESSIVIGNTLTVNSEEFGRTCGQHKKGAPALVRTR